jgi:hypothetical protein
LPLWGSVGPGIAINANGDYRGPAGIEDHLVYAARTADAQLTLSPADFQSQYGWVNEPWQVGLYKPGAESVERIYVNAASKGPFDGKTWQTAFSDLQDALSIAQPNTEICVAAGTYAPDRGTGARTASFHLKNDVRLLGGFAGTETSSSHRDPNNNETVLSGDLKGDDEPNFVNNEENSYHVVKCEWIGPNAVLDGFTITGGNANGLEDSEYSGGGLYSRKSGFTLLNCTFAANSAKGGGGGMEHGWEEVLIMKVIDCRFLNNAAEVGGGFYNRAASAELTNCVFRGNSATYDGGGLRNQEGCATLDRCVFANNRARDGGAMGNYNRARAVVRASRFLRNSTTQYGGAMNSSYKCVLLLTGCLFSENNAGGQGAGMFVASESEYTLISCVFERNRASWGGALSNDHCRGHLVNCILIHNTCEADGGAVSNEAGTQVDLINCTIAYNSAGRNGGGIYNSEEPGTLEENKSTSILINCILWGNAASNGFSETAQLGAGYVNARNCCVQGWTGKLGGIGNFGANPMFLDPNGPDGKIGTEDDDLRLSPGSPCINAGNNSALPADRFDLDGDGDPNEPIPFDVNGKPRIQGGTVDIGACESG